MRMHVWQRRSLSFFLSFCLSACISWKAPKTGRSFRFFLLPSPPHAVTISSSDTDTQTQTQTQSKQEAAETSTESIKQRSIFTTRHHQHISKDAMAAPMYLLSASRSVISHPCMPMAGLDHHVSALKSSSCHAFSTTNPVAMAMHSFSFSSASSSFVNKLPAELASATSNGSRVYCNMQVRHHVSDLF